jgi:hypothetical protein
MNASFESIARNVLDEILGIDENDCVVERKGKPIQADSAVKKLRRKFEKLVGYFGGDITALSDKSRTTQFDGLEQIFLHTVLTQLVTDTGISAELLKKPKKGDLELNEIHEYLQSMIEIMEDKGYGEEDILDKIPQIDALFRFSVLTSAENCHRFLVTLIWNMQQLPYEKQIGIMKKVESDINNAWMESTVVTIKESIFSELEGMIRERNIDVDIAEIRKDLF